MKLKMRWLSLPALLALSSLVLAQDVRSAALNSAVESLFDVNGFEQVAMSPDGTHLAYVGKPAKSGDTAIFLVDLSAASAKPKRISAATDGHAHEEGHLAWSEDGKKLAFLSDEGSENQMQLYVHDLATGSTQKLTSLTGFLDAPAWSPDGKTIAFLFTENAPRASGPLMPMTLETGVIETKTYEQRLATVNIETDEVHLVSPGDMYVYEYDWSPDGKTFAMTAAHGSGDANWYIAQLYTVGMAGGEMHSIYKPPLQIAQPRWSPDGKNIALIGGLMSDEGSTGGDIFLVPASGGSVRNITPGIAGSPNWIAWETPDRILFSKIVDGASGFATVETASGKIKTLWSGPEVLLLGTRGEFGLSLSRDHKTSAAIRQSYSHAPEIFVGPVGEWRQLTHANDGVKPSWGEAKSIHWMSDHTHVQGWLVYPQHYDPKLRYPMVVCVHGGPASAHVLYWPHPFFATELLSSQGYFVLYPNPRGSYGQGEAFTRANVKDFGYGDFRDILAGVDELVKTLPVDNDRVGITGWSYGGYMTMWAVTQTQRFRAAVAGAGLSNWQSYYGENDIDEWMIPYFGASVYDDPAVYAKSSPMNFIRNVKTPTLVLVGDRDGEVPPPQSREFWHALKTLGVDTQLVVYPNEGHFVANPEHERDIIQRMVGWFDEHMKSK